MLLILSCLVGACCKKDKCEGITCRNGYECNNGKCACPEGKVIIHGQCRKLEENEYYAAVRCRCIDTIAIGVDLTRYPNVDDSIERSVFINFNIANSTQISGGGTSGSYYKRPQGDSLYIIQITSGFLGCDLKGFPSEASFKGKVVLNNGKKELHGKILWWNEFTGPYHPTDSCSIILHK
jgi:hypothetical protein